MIEDSIEMKIDVYLKLNSKTEHCDWWETLKFEYTSLNGRHDEYEDSIEEEILDHVHELAFSDCEIGSVLFFSGILTLHYIKFYSDYDGAYGYDSDLDLSNDFLIKKLTKEEIAIFLEM